MYLVLVNCLGGLGLPSKSVIRLSDRPDMTIAAYCGCKIAFTLFANSTVSAFLGFSYIVGLLQANLMQSYNICFWKQKDSFSEVKRPCRGSQISILSQAILNLPYLVTCNLCFKCFKAQLLDNMYSVFKC